MRPSKSYGHTGDKLMNSLIMRIESLDNSFDETIRYSEELSNAI